MSETRLISTPQSERDRELDKIAFARLAEVHRTMAPLDVPAPAFTPAQVDLSGHLRFIRDQNGGAGCWGYSMVAIWDIMNDLQCPYSPNLSMRLWLLMHYRRELWESQWGIFTPDGRFHAMKDGPEFGLFQSLGNVTEGTELTVRAHPVSWPPEGLWTLEGLNEAANYRLKGTPTVITISSESFVNSLAHHKPIRLKIGAPQGQGHVIAVVGYDQAAATFTYVNSGGDNWGEHGFGTFTFRDIDTRRVGPNNPYSEWSIAGAETIDIHPPKPVPAARIAFTHTNRSNVHLWLYAEDSPLPRNKIWPQGWRENSRNLSYTVRVPSEFVWPPSAHNRLVLELYDAAEFSASGGQLVEFTTAFGGDVVPCPQLADGPIGFQAREHLQVCIP